ncbi:hypothetical protein GOBAR_DD19482 [Gossypium barbadense]|nr:hypothetical protein GOBAR_DD19482 [Gossypium barbadense]
MAGETMNLSVGKDGNLRYRNRMVALVKRKNQIALHDDVISKSFQEDRHLMTGLHTVADVYCCDCREVLGWKYERAYEETQKYKEGKFILEKSKIVKENCYGGAGKPSLSGIASKDGG